MPLPDLRLNVILAELAKHDRVFVKDLASQLRVSRETIRRDLKQLELDGHLRCTYGGGVKPFAGGGDQPIAQRMRVNAREKARVAARAAKLVQDDTTIFIDSGTTTLAFARHLVQRDRVRVFTNSLDIAQLLAGGSVGEVTVIGGRLRADYRAMLGPLAIEAIENHVFDAAFISSATVDYAHGFMDFGQDEASMRRVLVRHTKQVVMLEDGAKFGRTGAVRTLDLRQVHRLVTDAKLTAEFAAKLEEAGVEVLYA
jgi:DeoR/GlpR family transcriptional regulator of sugar metabolism